MSEAYQSFAQVYDTLMEDTPYDDWVKFTTYMIKKFGKESESIIDLGCGTGEVSIRLQQKGYHVTGVDLSTDMLAIAHEKATQNNSEITWVNQNIIELETPELYDVAISYCDVMNYITDLEDIKKSFVNINHLLNTDGLFLFDIHSEFYVTEFLANQTFAEVRDDLSYIWFCENGDDVLTVWHYLTFFIQIQNDNYYRFDEVHKQRTYPINTYQQLLHETGFQVLGIYSDFSVEDYQENGDRVFIVCQKK